MNNQDRYIPDHIKTRWDDTVGELAEVSNSRHAIEESYRQAAIGRMAALEARASLLEEDQHLADIVSQLVEVNRRYTKLVIARIALTDELRQWQMQTYFNNGAA